ncbi:LYR motif-containing protein 1 isoform X3 [Panthera tigris]|uniref:LYR motif-containing protein 1 isoform X3 n=1 Tax=Panthera leo TaxID=9689 RepID=UPI001C69C28E|nr:LYR motif-containing protein 1 isoform X3 [Panthera leo]XP_042827665.1 LYR motif-containing protein 1 isoform X3 [Panthera tigris]
MEKWQGLNKHSILAQDYKLNSFPGPTLQTRPRFLLICDPTFPTATRQEVLGLYRRIFRLVRKWQAASGQMEDTIKEKQYILNEARTLFQKNKNLTDTDLIKQCIDECTARIEIGLHYQIPYPRPIHLPPMGLTPLRGRGLRSQEKLRKLSKPVYLKSHDEIS